MSAFSIWAALAATAVLLFFFYRGANLQLSLAGLLALCGGSAGF